MDFRGTSWSEEFKKGDIYDLEGARAESLALRGLVKPFAEDAQVAKAPKVEEPVQTTKRIGRPRKTE